MAIAKTDLFQQKTQHCAKLFKALAHPARLEILKYLADTKTCISGDISNEIPLSRTTVNQHLAELKNAGLIKGTIMGTKTKYCINGKNVQQLTQMATSFFEQIEINEDFDC